MPSFLRRFFAPLTALALGATVAIPATLPIATEALSAAPLAAEYLPAAALPVASSAVTSTSFRLGADPATLLADEGATFGSTDSLDYATVAPTAPVRTAAAAPATRIAVSDDDMTCLAKAVRHEAGGQSREGQLAVAQLIVNRMRSGKFADSVCGVVNQQGQFFKTSSYNPDVNSAGWANAVAVSREVLNGETASVAPGALFFHAAFQSPRAFFRGRQRVASLGGNVFYR